MKTKTVQIGFTIVELLVVITVIGILAGLVLNSFSGTQERARNVVRITTSRSAVDIVKIALIDTTPAEIKAAMNYSDGWHRACIGAGYKDVNSDGLGDCGYWNNTPYVSTSTNLDSILSKVSSIPSTANYPELQSTDTNIVGGPYLQSAWVDSKDMLVMEYALEGEEQDCVVGPLVHKNVDGSTTLTPTSSPNYSESANGITECIVLVADTVY